MSDIVKLRNKQTGDVVTLRRKKPKQDFFDVATERVGFDPYKEIVKSAVPQLRSVPGIDTALEASKSPAFSYANQRLLNFPRALLTKAGYEMPEENWVSRGAGVYGGFQSITGNISKKVATRTAALPGGIGRWFKTPTFLQSMAKGAITGGITAPLYSTEENLLDIGKRASSIIPGAITGGAVGGLVHGGGQLIRGAKKGIETLKHLKHRGRIQSDIGETMRPAQLPLKTKIARREKRIKDIYGRKVAEKKQEIGKLKSKDIAERQVYEKTTSAAQDQLKRDLDMAKQDLFKTAQETGLTAKKNVSDMRGRISKVYGKNIDEIAERLAERGDDITVGQVEEILNSAIDSLREDGRPIPAKLAQLAKQYATTSVGKDGQVIDIQDPSKAVKLRAFLNNMRLLSEGKEQVFKGTATAKQAQSAELEVKMRMGDYLSSKDENFAQLQKEARPMLERLKVLGKGVKPGSLETEPSTRFMERYATRVAEGKPDQFTKESVDMLEKGITLMKEEIRGAGPVTDKLIRKAGAVKALSGKKVGGEYRSQYDAKIQELENMKNALERDAQAAIVKAKGLGVFGKERALALERNLNAFKRKMDLMAGVTAGAAIAHVYRSAMRNLAKAVRIDSGGDD